MTHPLAGQPAPKESLTDIPALLAAYAGRQPDIDDPAQRVAFGTSGHRGSALAGSFNEAHILAITQAICEYRAQAASTVRCTSARTRTRSRRPPSAPRSRCWRPTAWNVHAGGRRLHAHAGGVARDPHVQPRADRAARRRHRDHAVAQSAGRRRLQVQPAEWRPGRHRRHRLDRGARQRAAGRGQPRREARAIRAGPGRGEHHPGRLRRALRRRPGQRHRHGSHPRRGPAHRRRSAGRRGGGLLGADRGALRAGHRGRRSDGRSHLRVHDARPRRQDPHGLLAAPTRWRAWSR